MSLGGIADCYGGNIPGSGNLPLNCDDGGYNYGYSGDIKFEMGGLYLTAAYELHNGVNRSSDGVGSNNPILRGTAGRPRGQRLATPANALSLKILDWSDYHAICGGISRRGRSGLARVQRGVDTVNECAMKFGGQYTFDFGLTVSYIYEDLHRERPSVHGVSERAAAQRRLAGAEYVFNGGADRVAVGWAHAGAAWVIRVDSTTTTRTASVTTRPTCTPSAGGTSSTSS